MAGQRGIVVVPEFDPFGAIGFAFEFRQEEHGPLYLACPGCDIRIGSCYVVSSTSLKTTSYIFDTILTILSIVQGLSSI